MVVGLEVVCRREICRRHVSQPGRQEQINTGRYRSLLYVCPDLHLLSRPIVRLSSLDPCHHIESWEGKEEQKINSKDVLKSRLAPPANGLIYLETRVGFKSVTIPPPVLEIQGGGFQVKGTLYRFGFWLLSLNVDPPWDTH